MLQFAFSAVIAFSSQGMSLEQYLHTTASFLIISAQNGHFLRLSFAFSISICVISITLYRASLFGNLSGLKLDAKSLDRSDDLNLASVDFESSLSSVLISACL